ncbi:MAG: ferrous iron transport protein B [Bacteroidales bacterium]|nr:ferrous iron transport protein B [Bacteroidales bacterium]
MNLSELEPGSKATILRVKGRGAFRKRITEMGFVVGKEVTVVKKAPLQDPVEYNILGYNVTLRMSEAQLIEVDPLNITEQEINYSGTLSEDSENRHYSGKNKIIHVAFVGNPNSGKTTLFNYASNSRERVGNYSGVTVDAKEAKFEQEGYEFIITDLPGTYSITAYSPEELYVRDFINENMPDVVVNVVDASNLERNLYLTTQLIDMDIRVIVALNMFDELERKGDILDFDHLGKMLGVPFIPTVASRGKGIRELFSKIIEVCEGSDQVSRHIHINYGRSLEEGIKAVQKKIRIPENDDFLNKISSRFLAIKLLEKDPDAVEKAKNLNNAGVITDTVQRERARIELEQREDTETLITDAKYGFIAGALTETMKANPQTRRHKSEIIDTFITHKIWGIPIFIGLMWATFYGTFKIGNYPMKWIEWMVQEVSLVIQLNMADGMFKDLLIQGVIGGVGGVIIFLPNILLLYLFISLMEDTGYMARAVFIMDKAMHKIGLHGKSFIPLLMGFGCNVPAILSTRIIESRRDRLITMLINPFMSCSARLPVYILFITAFFQSYQGTILFGIYFTGVLLAIGSALVFRKTIFRKKDVPFVMELPPYRVPTMRSIVRHMWHRTGQYLQKIGGIILVSSIIIWALGYFPVHFAEKQQIEKQISGLKNEISLNNQSLNQPQNIKDSINLNISSKIKELEFSIRVAQQKNSFIGRIGHFIEPVMRPLGFDWKMSVALLTGVSAKEVVVGTLGVLYQTENSGEGTQPLVEKLQNQYYTSGVNKGKPVFTPLVALSFMLFILIYFPCIGVVSAISRESGHWKWAAFVVVYTTSLAYLGSLALFQIGSLFF